MSFSILQPGRILFGRGVAAQAPRLALEYGTRGLVVHGRSGDRAASLLSALTQAGAAVLALPCPDEPTLPMLEAALSAARPHQPDWVLAIGGGAALDLGKALAALIPAPGSPLDHLEVVGRALPLTADPLPFLAMPTTAGTGAEVTKNAVIGLPDHGRKVSLRDDRMIARVAIVDPALTDNCPPAITLASGLDAVTQVIEPFLCTKPTPYTDALTSAAIRPGLSALKALMQAEDAGARDRLAWVSVSGGLALANAGLGAVHGLAGVIGGQTGAAHGAICGTLLGPVLSMNRRLTSGPMRDRVEHVCALIAAELGGTAADAPERLADWAHAAGLPSLTTLGLTERNHQQVAAASLEASSMKANPVAPSIDDLLHALGAG